MVETDPVARLRHHAKSLMQSGDSPGAINAYRRLLEQSADDPESHYHVGMLLAQSGMYGDALRHLHRANVLQPGSADVMQGLGAVLFAGNQLESAVEYLQKALELSPRLSGCHYYLGNVFLMQGNASTAIQHYEHAYTASPHQLDLLINYANACEQMQALGKCRELIESALAISPENPSALLILARIHKRGCAYEEAKHTLDRILRNEIHPSIAASSYTLLGHVMDRSGKYDEAFEAFQRASQLHCEAAKSAAFDGDHYLSLIKQTKAICQKQSGMKRKYPYGKGEHISPIFFVGFPRSGTTLMEQILNTRPHLVPSGEVPIIDQLIRECEGLAESEAPVFRSFDNLTEIGAERLRKRYFDLFSQAVRPLQEGDRVVDKLPLNIVHLGFINAIFPGAKIIVALRDPRDCCLSGFMQEFRLNPAMIQLMTLESSARFYDQVMDLWLCHRETLNMDYIEYRYEDLVESFDTVTRNLFEFINEGWDGGIHDFHESGNARQINTPSYHDVNSPLYSRAVRRWERYQAYLEPVYPLLEKYVKMFGYPEQSHVMRI